MVIDANTKIGAILKKNAAALEVIISLNPKFEKLRNPLLRKLMAGRTSLAMASQIGGINIDEFFRKLEPLGFTINRNVKEAESVIDRKPAFLLANKSSILDLDVRPVISSGKDPLNVIMQKLKTVKDGDVLRIINSFEPTPLILLLSKKGYSSFVEKQGENYVETYLWKNASVNDVEQEKPSALGDWDEVLQKFDDRLVKIDVRGLEMPQPMHKILSSLEEIPADHALYVYHKRIPVYLLPELSDRGFEYRFKEIGEGEVHLLIYKLLN